jgi:uncharacterized membrane protein YhaH (DUF805 family)
LYSQISQDIIALWFWSIKLLYSKTLLYSQNVIHYIFILLNYRIRKENLLHNVIGLCFYSVFLIYSVYCIHRERFHEILLDYVFILFNNIVFIGKDVTNFTGLYFNSVLLNSLSGNIITIKFVFDIFWGRLCVIISHYTLNSRLPN